MWGGGGGGGDVVGHCPISKVNTLLYLISLELSVWFVNTIYSREVILNSILVTACGNL